MNQSIPLIDELASNQVIVSEVSVINVTSEAEENLKPDLEGICAELVDALEIKLMTPPLSETKFNAFNNI